jgi:hypothetical protein
MSSSALDDASFLAPSMMSVKMACDRELTSFILVAPVTR